MKKSRRLLIFSILLILIFLWLILLILIKEPHILIISVILGIIFVLIIIYSIIEILFPKNKFSKKFEKILDEIINDLSIT